MENCLDKRAAVSNSSHEQALVQELPYNDFCLTYKGLLIFVVISRINALNLCTSEIFLSALPSPTGGESLVRQLIFILQLSPVTMTSNDPVGLQSR